MSTNKYKKLGVRAYLCRMGLTLWQRRGLASRKKSLWFQLLCSDFLFGNKTRPGFNVRLREQRN